MKRIYWFVVVAIAFVLIVPRFGYCLEDQKDAQTAQVSTCIVLKQDQVIPDKGKSFDSQGLSIYWHNDSFGAGIDVDMTRKFDFIQVKPYLTFNKGPWYLVGGVSHGDAGDYVQAGFWYVNTLGKFNVLADIRNNFGLNKESTDFLECFFEVTHPIGSTKFYAGVDAVVDHWWEGNHQWYMAGPLVGYQFTKNISVFVRVTHEWDVLESQTSESDRLRVGLVFQF